MAAKKNPSVQKRLQAALNELHEAKVELAAKQKELDSARNMLSYHEGQARESSRELAQIHSFLDAVPSAPASKAGDGYTSISAMTRLSVWLATRGQQAGA